MSGIAMGMYCHFDIVYLLSAAAVLLLVLLAGLFKMGPGWLFGFSVMALMFVSGVFVERMQSNEKAGEWSGAKLRYEATLVEVPLFRGTDVKVLADVSVVDTVMSQGMRDKGLVYLYISRDVDSDTLGIGDVISFESKIEPVRNAGNPAEFDIESYYYIKGISGRVYLRSGSWNSMPPCEMSVAMEALAMRERVVGLYRSLGLHDNEESLLSALTIGEKRDFPKELKESYSIAGASHVLALSGLHLGIFYMLLLFILPYRGDRRAIVVVRECLVVLLLWTFAFVAGLSPSVVRAAILFTLVSAGRCLQRESSSMNSLAFAAIVMLLFDPHLLFDMSFQLSFAAVFSILVLAPHLQRAMNVTGHGATYGYIVNILILSFAAQVGTLPFVWYHFGVFPVYFFLTNLFVVPMAFVVMFLAVAMWVLSPLPLLGGAVAWGLGLAVKSMNAVVTFISELPFASYELPSIGVCGAFAVAVALMILVFATIGRKWWLVILTIFSMVVYAGVHGLLSEENECEDYMLVYNNRRNPLVHVVSASGNNSLVSTVPKDDAEYEYVSSPYIKREHLPAPLWANVSCRDSLLQLQDGLLSFSGVTLRLLDNGNWGDSEFIEPVDVLLLCRGFLGSISELLEVYPTNCIVLDASLYKSSRERILKECCRLGVDAVDISVIGAVKIVPASESFTLYPMRDK